MNWPTTEAGWAELLGVDVSRVTILWDSAEVFEELEVDEEPEGEGK